MGAFNEGAAPVGVLVKALTENVFVEKNLAFMNEGDKDGYNVYKFNIKNVLEPRSADPMSALVASHKKQAFKRNLSIVQSKESFDPAEYHNHWKGFQPEGLFQWEGLPKEIQSTLEELFLGSAAEATEDTLTNGNAVVGVTGLIPQLLNPAFTALNGAEPTSDQIVNNTAIAFRAHGGGAGDELSVALTTSNIFKKLELLIKKQTKSMRKRSDRKFMAAPSVADLITEAQRLELNFKGVDVTEEGNLRYAGYDIITNSSFPDDTILFCSMSGDMKNDAIQMGTSMSGDFNNLTVDRISNFSREWGMLLTFAIDIFVVRPEEVCFYTPETVV